MPNRLAAEKSPYLLQHANNPVDWYAWGEEAFAKARSENKPIFLSVGYSTCHWCHVMERESFENAAVAETLNHYFVPVKVDREERPDVDRIYMLFVQATTGSGGWPMSVWLTPDLKPFFGGTYFPPDNRYGRPGFKSILEQLARAWASDRAKIEDSSVEVTNSLEQYSTFAAHAGGADPGLLDSAFFAFRRSFDTRLGGFGGAPKFPRPSVLNFLLRYYARQKNEEALDMAALTLREMARGGMNDQLGGGFHRYSVDDRWFVPHFEKMLYDQAQLAVSYLEAFQITREERFAETARDIFEYVLRDMRHPEGGFYSAEDADSVIDQAHPEEKGEGAFYVWSRAELAAILPPGSLEPFCRRYGVEEGGNVRDDPHGEFGGKNILYEARAVDSDLTEARRIAFEARGRRIRPHLDDKVLTSWNALMITAFSKGAQILGEPRYEQAARAAVQFVLKRLFDPGKADLRRRFREGESAIGGFLDDYAFFIQALLDFYETTFEGYYLELAAQLAARMIELFEDHAGGAFYSTAENDGRLILRIKEDYDGAEPSGNSIAVLVLLRLARMTGREEFEQSAEHALRAFAQRMTAAPSTMPQMLAAFQFSLTAPRQVIFEGPLEQAAPLIRAVRERFLPDLVVMTRNPSGPVSAHVCENFACQLPVTNVDDLIKLLE